MSHLSLGLSLLGMYLLRQVPDSDEIKQEETIPIYREIALKECGGVQHLRFLLYMVIGLLLAILVLIDERLPEKPKTTQSH